MAQESTPLVGSSSDGGAKPFPDWSSPKLYVDICLSILIASLVCWIICCFVGDATLQGVWITNTGMVLGSLILIIAGTIYFTYYYLVEWNEVTFFTRFGTIGMWTGVICYAWCYGVANHAKGHMHLRG